MGCWSVGLGRIKIEPEVTDELIGEYKEFSRRAEAFQDREEIFGNPWHFDEDNMLVCFPGKFCEPSEWFNEVKSFFEQKGYRLIGDPDIVWEGDSRFSLEPYMRK